jgi:transcriptional regulator with XRE-family HTH domain
MEKEFSKILVKLRNQKKISQQSLANISSYTQTYISLIETGGANPSERCKTALINALNSVADR